MFIVFVSVSLLLSIFVFEHEKSIVQSKITIVHAHINGTVFHSSTLSTQ